jgi:DNA-directed RNA polymerase subunit RPC12/RpoP
VEDHSAPTINESLSLPCPSCGSELRYSAEHRKLRCDYCGYVEEIDHSNDKVVEKSLTDAANKLADFVPEDFGKKVFDCQNCGAKFMVESEKVKVKCGFCGSTKVNLEAYQHQYIQPVGIIPFYVSRDEAESKFKDWIRRGWFHPSKLKRMAALEDLHGIYLPCWTYDAQTESDWRGDAGYYYYETRMVRVNGKMQPQQVQKIRWQHRSGHLSHFFDDILVVASGGLEQKALERILPFRLEEVVNFDPRLMMGWESEIYNLEVDKGYQVADEIMDFKIRHMCSAQLGGDTQRNLRVSSQKFEQTFKHIILPAWICSYTYRDKLYHFSINGQTGKVHGQKPISWIKIAILVVLFALIIVGIYYLRESGILQQG